MVNKEPEPTLLESFWEIFWETKTPEDQVAISRLSRSIKVMIIGFVVLKSVLLIALSETGYASLARVPMLQSVIILAVIGCISNLMGFAGAHFRLKNLSLLFGAMDAIIVAAEVAVLSLIAKATATSTYQSVLIFYIAISAINVAIIALSFTIFAMLYRKEEAEEKAAEEEKKRHEEEDEKLKRESQQTLKKKRREDRRIQRELARAAELELPPSAPLKPLVPPLPSLSSLGKAPSVPASTTTVAPTQTAADSTTAHPHATADDL